MLNVTPFLLFDGNCAEAMIFYQKCIGGELTLTKLGDTSMKESNTINRLTSTSPSSTS
jgi:PhnB protein